MLVVIKCCSTCDDFAADLPNSLLPCLLSTTLELPSFVGITVIVDIVARLCIVLERSMGRFRILPSVERVKSNKSSLCVCTLSELQKKRQPCTSSLLDFLGLDTVSGPKL